MSFRATRFVKQTALFDELKTGLHRISIDDVSYNATLDMHYIPKLDANRAALRLNETDKTQISFFDCDQNVWVSVPYDGELK
ncbi:hypothetical protein VPHF86_0022 [Vibrio phage F86]